MNNRIRYIKKGDLISGREYYCLSRNFEICTWNGNAFVGDRFKFGSIFVCEDQHWDDGGTIKPLVMLSLREGSDDPKA